MILFRDTVEVDESYDSWEDFADDNDTCGSYDDVYLLRIFHQKKMFSF